MIRRAADSVLLRLTGTRFDDWDPRRNDSVPARVVSAYGEYDIAEHAAALAFNTLLSVFPILVGMAFLLDRIASNPTLATGARVALISLFPPDAQSELHRILTGLQGGGGTLGLLTFASFVWGGSGLYAALETPLARIYGLPTRSFWRQRLHGLVMVPLFAGAIAWAMAINGLAEALPFGEVVAFVLGSTLLTGFSMRLYQLVPTHRYPLKMVFPGALFTGVSTELLGLGLPLLNVLNGDMGAYGSGIAFVLLLSTWLFLLSQILLVGACVNHETQGRFEGALPLNVPLIPRSRLVLVFMAVCALVLVSGIIASIQRPGGAAAADLDDALHCADPIPGTTVSFCTAGGASAAALPGLEGPVATEAGLLDRLRGRVLAKLAQRYGIVLDRIGLAGVDLYIDRAISRADNELLRTTLESDLGAIETAFGRPLRDRPAVFAFGTAESFRGGLESLFGYEPSIARTVATTSGGVLITSLRTIAINWASVAAERPVTIIRHELAHTALREATGARPDIPAWFDEGLAALEQRALARPDEALRQAGVAAALAVGGGPRLQDLATRSEWLRHAQASGGRIYALSASAVALLDQDLGRTGLLRLLERAKAVPFEVAFEEIAGRSLRDFSTGAPARVAAQAPAPRITVRRIEPGSLQWSASGLPPFVTGEARIEGQGYDLRFSLRADQDGKVGGTFGQTAAPGTYLLRLTFDTVVISAELDTR